MKKLSKPAIAVVLIVSSLGLAATVSAKPGGDRDCGRGGQQGFNVERIADKLDLNDEQRVQIAAVVDKSSQQMASLRDQMKANREQLRELSQQSPFDETAVRNVADTQGDLKANMIVLRAQQRAEINAILTDEQRAQWEEKRGKRGRYR
ncbi:MAG: Spy/CpxP family protein refolding chaperone [Candidatus Competibacteraceae bacterium]|jgi:Spy/CpxP family protein refolding chaperone|nr:Spy/CpxP family protein refolding chaperone [Candidatus Competibacteraceae bacterium]